MYKLPTFEGLVNRPELALGYWDTYEKPMLPENVEPKRARAAAAEAKNSLYFSGTAAIFAAL